jgi:hypothetical protein
MATGNFDIVALLHGYSGHSLLPKSLTVPVLPASRYGVKAAGLKV